MRSGPSRAGSAPATRQRAAPEARSEEVQAGGDGDREGHAGIAVVALEDQDQARDEQDDDRCGPADPAEVHVVILAAATVVSARRGHVASAGPGGGNAITST